MPTFGELLTSHISRSGISDADLAWRIGVSRPTLIRWKEGVIARPRYREDVLRCAEVLRLTPEERDELLVATEFEPEVTSVVAVSSEPADAALDVPQAAPVSSTVPPGRRRRLLIGGTVGALSAVAAISVALLLSPFSLSNEPEHPLAQAGESLIVIAPFANFTGGELAFNIRGRLRASLDREIAAAELEGIRTEDWPEELPGHHEALTAARNSGAAIIIWGEYDSGRVLANLTSIPTQGYRVSKLANWRSIVVRKLSSQPARFSLPRMDPLLGSSRARFNATFHNSAYSRRNVPSGFVLGLPGTPHPSTSAVHFLCPNGPGQSH